jgi:cytochrome d ubiquinol oxidase subunit II
MHLDLPLIWAAILAFAVFAYVVLDGFDLGTGILFLVERDRNDRDLMVNTIAPVWDGNETWLVFGGGALFAVFPLAYSVILPALYPLIIAMLLGLVLRGVAFEFRSQATHLGRGLWDMAFCGGSILAAFCQGLILGGLMQGIHVVGHAYAGGWWDWLNGFTILCGAAVVTGYGLLGSCWILWRTEGPLHERNRRRAAQLGVATLVFVGVVSIISPFLHPQFMQRWFKWPGIALTSPVPILMLVVIWQFRRGLRSRHQFTPLLCAELLFLLCYAGLALSFYPFLVPPSITIWDASAPASSQGFLLVGAVVMVPIILIYSAFSYWTFRGKVQVDAGYH